MFTTNPPEPPGPSEPPEWEYVPEGWRTQEVRAQGFDVESVPEVEKNKWAEFVRLVEGNGPLGIAHEAPVLSSTDYAAHNEIMSYAYVLAQAARAKDRLSILDWGGGLGHFYVLSKALLPGVKFDYHCKDFARFCKHGRLLSPDATFHDDDSCLERRYDLVLASGALQCIEDWQGTVARLAAISQSYLYVTKLPIVQSAASFVAVQRPYFYGYNTEYLCWFLNRTAFLDHLKSLDMELVREFLIHQGMYVYYAPEQGEFRGFLFRPRLREGRRDECGSASCPS